MRLANGKIVLDDSIHYCLQQTTLPPLSSSLGMEIVGVKRVGRGTDGTRTMVVERVQAFMSPKYDKVVERAAMH